MDKKLEEHFGVQPSTAMLMQELKALRANLEQRLDAIALDAAEAAARSTFKGDDLFGTYQPVKGPSSSRGKPNSYGFGSLGRGPGPEPGTPAQAASRAPAAGENETNAGAGAGVGSAAAGRPQSAAGAADGRSLWGASIDSLKLNREEPGTATSTSALGSGRRPLPSPSVPPVPRP